MNQEEKINQDLERIRQASAENKSIDVAALALNTLSNRQSNLLPAGLRRLSYFISLAFPPFGLGFAVWFLIRREDDAKKTAIICAVLTIVSILLTILIFNTLFKASGLTPGQVKNIDLQEYQDLLNGQ